MTDKLTAAGLKASLKVQRYLAFSGAPSLGAEPQNPLVVVHGYAMVRKDVADAAILGLEDMRTQMMARIAKLEAENKRLKSELRWEVELCELYQRRQIDRLMTDSTNTAGLHRCECGSSLFHGPWSLVISPNQTVMFCTCAACGRMERLEDDDD